MATLPLCVVLAVAVRRDGLGPALLRQERIGRKGEPFAMWKFRTMPPEADAGVFSRHLDEIEEAAASGGPEQPHLAIDHDLRVTRFGRFLRRWSLDELPNVWNVVRGDMSLVGPRPLIADEAALVARLAGPEVANGRLSVAPGITGLAQVRGRDDISLDERSVLDLEYVAARSVSLDLWILIQTTRTVLGHRGR